MDESQVHDIVDASISDLQAQIKQLQEDMQALSGDFYSNNFSSSQDFQKYSRFNNRLKIPTNTSLPATCHTGEVCVSTGIAYVCSAPNTWTKIGLQS